MIAPAVEDNVVPLDPVRHRHLGFDPSWPHAGSAVPSHQVPIGPAEFEALASHYPVLFVDGGAVALFSRTEADNSCMREDGRWEPGVHLPDRLRCHPLAAMNGVDRSIGIDEGALLPDPADGAALFDGDGHATPALSARLSGLRHAVRGQRAAADLQERLEALGLLESIEVTLASPDGWYYRLATYRVIRGALVSDLSPGERASLRRKGLLRSVEAHQHSLDHLAALPPPRDALAEHQDVCPQTSARAAPSRMTSSDRSCGIQRIDLDLPAPLQAHRGVR